MSVGRDTPHPRCLAQGDRVEAGWRRGGRERSLGHEPRLSEWSGRDSNTPRIDRGNRTSRSRRRRSRRTRHPTQVDRSRVGFTRERLPTPPEHIRAAIRALAGGLRALPGGASTGHHSGNGRCCRRAFFPREGRSRGGRSAVKTDARPAPGVERTCHMCGVDRQGVKSIAAPQVPAVDVTDARTALGLPARLRH